jgi:hypothetical protein
MLTTRPRRPVSRNTSSSSPGHRSRPRPELLEDRVVPAALSINDISVLEGASGNTAAVFTVSLSEPVEQNVTVSWATSNGMAFATDADYVAASGTVTMPAGSTSGTITVQVRGDLKYEIDETFHVNLSNPSGATIADGQGVGTIRNDDAVPSIQIGDVAQIEGQDGNVTNFAFQVTLSNPSFLPITVDYATADVTAAAGSDYTAGSGSLSWSASTGAGSTPSRTITVPVLLDAALEGTETFHVNLSNPTNATIADGTGLGTIIDQRYTFTRIADTFSPGSPYSSFSPFNVVLNNQGQFAFAAVNAAGGSSVYFGDENGITEIVRAGIDIPEPSVNNAFLSLSNSGDVVIRAADGALEALYCWSEGQLRELVRTVGIDVVGFTSINRPDVSDSGYSVFHAIYRATVSPTTAISGFFKVPIDGSSSPTFVIGTMGTSEVLLNGLGPPSLADTGEFVYDIGLLYAEDGRTEAHIRVSNLSGPGFETIYQTEGSVSSILDVSMSGDGRYVAFKDFTGDSGTERFVALIDRQNDNAVTIVGAQPTFGQFSTDPPSVNRNGDVAFVGNFLANAVANGVYTGPDPATDVVMRRGMTLDGILVNSITHFGTRSLNDHGEIFFGLGTLSAGGSALYLARPILPALSIDNASVTEGDSGTKQMTFTVTLSAPFDKAVTVQYATANGTATSGSDYTAASGALTFAPGETQKTVAVTILGDSTFEADETFSVVLSDPIRATILNDAGTGTIVNDDPMPAISIDSVAANEGNAGTTPFVFAVNLSNPGSETITVDFTTVAGSAGAGSDFEATSGTLTFEPGDVSRLITVAVTGETTDEFDETFSVTLSNPVGAVIIVSAGTGTIRNDDTPPQVSIDNVTLTEGNSGTKAFPFTVSLTEPSGKTVTVDYATTDGTAAAGSDYAAAAGSLTFAPGETSKPITVQVNGDTVVEPDEGFFVDLSGAANATIAVGRGTGTILNDDAQSAVTLSINDVALFEGDSGATEMVFTVSLSSAPDSTVTVSYATANGAARSSGNSPDFVRASGTLTFNPGDPLAKTITVLVNGDAMVEPDETFLVNLSGAVNAVIADGTGVGTIINDDILPELSIGDASEFEGDGGTTALVFAVSLSSPSASAVTVKYATANGSAVSQGRNSDFSRVRGTLTFEPGELLKTITVPVNGDTLPEADETLFVNLSSPDGAAIIDGQGLGTIRNDDGIALRLAGAAGRSARGRLTDAALASLAGEARSRWRAAGVGLAGAAALERVSFHVADLPGNQLGRALPGRVLIDRDAAGRGWFVDPTPADDSEFGARRGRGVATRRVDLLSVVRHEMGHILGLGHAERQGGLMSDRLRIGSRGFPARWAMS